MRTLLRGLPPRTLLSLLTLFSIDPARADGPLPTSPSWMVFGQHQAHFGFAVASAGDVNGDNFDDVIVGADFYDNGQTDEGGAWVYFGSPAGADTTPAWTGEGNQMNAFFGYSVASAGDVNGDSYDDIIVGAPGRNRAHVYAGSAGGLATTPLWTGVQSWSYGISVASAGDVNGDFYDDILVGAMNFSNDLALEGKAFLYLGGAAGPAMTPSWTAEGDQTGARLGYSVASAGDVNGDGFADVIVGAPDFDGGEMDEGRAFVYLGSAAGLATSPAWTAESDQAGAAFGLPVATAGDVNGDGYDDVIVASFLYDVGQSDDGRAWVYRGSASGLGTIASWTYNGQNRSELGISLASAGDTNHDGFDDILIGVPHHQNPEYVEGAALAFLGSAAGPSLLPDWIVEGNLPPAGETWGGPHLGWSAAPAGDVNGDLHGDVIIGAPFSHCPDPNDPQACGPIPGWASIYHGISVTSVSDGLHQTPLGLAPRLLSSRPNPFAPPGMITYVLPGPGWVRLSIVDTGGRQVAALLDQAQGGGEHAIAWDGLDARGTPLPSGIYLTRLEAAGRVLGQKWVLAR